MKVLIVGSGGREHALAWKIRQSPQVRELFCAPGNAGIESVATTIPLKPTDTDGLLRFAVDRGIDLTVIGPEQPLVNGIVDRFQEQGLAIFGPSSSAARLEGSKAFAKDFMRRHAIPTARYGTFTRSTLREAERFIGTLSLPMVIKADGLAAGKGVLICKSQSEAIATVRDMVEQQSFGSAGDNVVVEEFLAGEEVSVFAISDGADYVILAPAQDHKRIFDGDQGKNTGGMGAYAPAPLMTPELLSTVEQTIIRPTLEGMKAEGKTYRGCLYAGLMMTPDGPKVLEYNCRFGDPETQVVVPLIDGDLALLLQAAATGSLSRFTVGQHPASAVCVVMASRGYPDAFETGKVIRGLDSADLEKGEIIFHAGTARKDDAVVTSGGRVLGVTAVGYAHELDATIEAAYRIVHRVAFDGAYYRSDVGKKGLKYLQKNRGGES